MGNITANDNKALDEINTKFNSLSEVFNGENIIQEEFVEENKEKIIEITDEIISIRSSMEDDGITHDIDQFIGEIMYLNFISDGMLGNKINDIFLHYNNALNLIINNKDIFSFSETFDIIKTKALNYHINLDLNDDINNDSLNINFNMKRLLDNLIKNSREAGTTEVKINFKESSRGNIVMEYIDNGHGITEDVLLNTLFIKGESTKLESGINSGAGMHGLAKLFSDKEVYLDVISKTKDEYISKSFLPYSFSEIISGNINIGSLVFHDNPVKNGEDLLYATGTKFVFEFKGKEVS